MKVLPFEYVVPCNDFDESIGNTNHSKHDDEALLRMLPLAHVDVIKAFIQDDVSTCAELNLPVQ